MPVSYTIDREHDALLITGSGRVADPEIHQVLKTVFRDPAFHPDIRVLADYSKITDLTVSAEKAANFASTVAYSGKSRRAFLVHSPHIAGYIRFFTNHHSRSIPTRIFYEREAALAWLNEGMPEEKRLK